MLKKPFHLTDKGYKDLKKAIAAALIAGLTLYIPFLIIMQIMQVVIAPLSGAPLDTQRLWILAGFGVLAAVVYAIAYGIEYDCTYTTAYRESTAVRVEVAERLRKLPLSFFNRKDLSELTTNIMADCSSVEEMMSHTVPQLCANIIGITLVCLSLAFYNWRMALALFCTLPVSMAIVVTSKKLQARHAERHVEAKLNVTDQMQEYLDGIKVVKAFGLAGEKFTALEKALTRMMKQSIIFEAAAGSFVTLAAMILQVGCGIVILAGVFLLSGGSLNVIEFLIFTVISVKIYGPVLGILTMLPETLYLLVSTKRMQALRSEPLMTGEETVSIQNFNIELKNVSFAYNQDMVINGINLTIPQNGVTALVGPSGSGKTTLSRLIARFWDVKAGDIFIGGKNIRDIDPERLMTWMSFVFQDVVLFNDTVMNNIRIGKKDATDEEVYAAAKLARCDEFIREMPEGYNTLLGENGSTISGGERQRISIARALLKNAPIVLLDEATASLDPENETRIQEAISELVRGRTVIVIAHRLRTVIGADHIAVLENGRLVEEGTGEELLAKNGLFARLYTIQQESLGWSVTQK